jgi:hypothetical protein
VVLIVLLKLGLEEYFQEYSANCQLALKIGALFNFSSPNDFTLQRAALSFLSGICFSHHISKEDLITTLREAALEFENFPFELDEEDL